MMTHGNFNFYFKLSTRGWQKTNNHMRHYILLFLFGIGVASAAISQTDSSKVAITRFEKVSTDTRVNNIFIDDRNIIWLSTDKGMIETTGDGEKFVVHFGGTEFKDAVSDRKGQVWACSSQKLFEVKSQVSFPLPVLGAEVKDIAYLEGNIWIGTNRGLFQFNVSSAKFKQFDEKNSKLASDIIHFVHVDKRRILWIGTDKGYVRIEENDWDLFDKKTRMLATCENNEGQWIISDNDMFLISPFNRLYPVQLDPSQYKGTINNFVLDSKGRIYIASDILVRYDPYTEKIDNYTEDAASLSKAALSLACDRNDNIWIGTAGAGFYKLLFGDIAKEQLAASCLVDAQVLCHNGNSGAIKVNVTGGSRPYSYRWNRPGLSGNVVSSLGAGYYEVTVTDKNQFTSIASVELTAPGQIQIETISNNRVTNPDNPDGSILVKVSGGISGYKYTWSNGQTTEQLSAAKAGQYKLVVKDRNGCMQEAVYNVKREKFIPELEITKIKVGQKLRINELNFQADSVVITQENYEILEEVFDFLNAHPGVSVEIGGHTNTIPPHEYCDRLSTARAQKVAEFLYERGILRERISYKGYGKREPLTDSTTAQGRQRNQRVEIKILEI